MQFFYNPSENIFQNSLDFYDFFKNLILEKFLDWKLEKIWEVMRSNEGNIKKLKNYYKEEFKKIVEKWALWKIFLNSHRYAKTCRKSKKILENF